MLLQAEDSVRYCCDTVSTSAMTMSVSSTFLVTSAASFFRFSSVVMMVSSSRIRPFTSLRAWSRDFSSWRKRSWNSPTRERTGAGEFSLISVISRQPFLICHVFALQYLPSHLAVWGGRIVSHRHLASRPWELHWDTGSEGCCVSRWSLQM